MGKNQKQYCLLRSPEIAIRVSISKMSVMTQDPTLLLPLLSQHVDFSSLCLPSMVKMAAELQVSFPSCQLALLL